MLEAAVLEVASPRRDRRAQPNHCRVAPAGSSGPARPEAAHSEAAHSEAGLGTTCAARLAGRQLARRQLAGPTAVAVAQMSVEQSLRARVAPAVGSEAARAYRSVVEPQVDPAESREELVPGACPGSCPTASQASAPQDCGCRTSPAPIGVGADRAARTTDPARGRRERLPHRPPSTDRCPSWGPCRSQRRNQ